MTTEEELQAQTFLRDGLCTVPNAFTATQVFFSFSFQDIFSKYIYILIIKINYSKVELCKELIEQRHAAW
jgi:hypothetical protein